MSAFPNEPLPLDPRKVAQWAYVTGLWKPKDTPPEDDFATRCLRMTQRPADL